jgi:hypothetical protein
MISALPTEHIDTEPTNDGPRVTRRDRLIAVSFFWIAFAVVSTLIYGNYIHDVHATYWALWTFFLPVALPFVWLFDFAVSKFPPIGLSPARVLGCDCVFAASLWFVPWLGIAFAVVAAAIMSDKK